VPPVRPSIVPVSVRAIIIAWTIIRDGSVERRRRAIKPEGNSDLDENSRLRLRLSQQPESTNRREDKRTSFHSFVIDDGF